MGQRHQLFVIAKIANRYRGLAVFHHQWLYGYRALRQCLALLTIFSAPANRLAILQELAAARRHSENFWAKPLDYTNNEVPFPFITTCLLLGASFNVEDGYNARVILEPFNMAFNMGDNNDGITIIDITDLSHVRYCFVLWNEWHFFQSDEVEESQDFLMRPLSGPTYLSAYYDAKQRAGAEHQHLMQQYDRWDLIEVDALANTWPQGKWIGAASDSGRDADIPTATPTPTLRQCALAHLVETSLASTDTDLPWITEAELLPDFLPAIRTKLGSEPTLIASPAAKTLLPRAVKDEQEVDLSQFPDLSTDDLVSLTSRLSDKTTSISISGPGVTATLLGSHVLAGNNSLRRLYVLDAPNLPLQSALRLMCQPGSPWIYHSDMFRNPLDNRTPSNSNRPCNAIDRDTPQPKSNEASFIAEERADFPVVQLFWLSQKAKTRNATSRLDDGGIPGAQLLLPLPNQFSRSDMVVRPVGDTLLPITRVVTGLAKFVYYLTRTDKTYFIGNEAGIVAAKCFALAASDLRELDVTKQVEVHPLPKELFTTAAPDLQPLRPGEWTIIIAHEPPECGEHPSEEMLRYAFLTASDPAAPSESDTTITSSPATEYEDITAPGGRHGVVIADMKVFLERVMNNDPLAQEALLNFWNEATRGLADRFGVCGKVEMVSVLEAMDFLFFRQSYR